LQAEKEVRVGNFYWKKGSFRAAARRYEEATRWNPGLLEAYLKLGEAREKLRDSKGAREAYQKYLELDPKAKNAEEIRKRLAKLPKS
jgi:tetratricopeptide (TPR) repeat protein